MKGAIFDMDGTLLDSMQVWVHVGEQYLRNRGIEPEEGLGDVLFPMSMRDGAVYVKEKYSLPDPPDTIVTDMDAIVFAAYRDEVLPKPGVAAYLESLKKQGIPMAVATATNRPMVEAALARMGADRDGMVYIGDSEVDVQTAASVGCPCISCTWGFRSVDDLLAAGATTFVNTPAELERVLLGRPGQTAR